VVEACQASEHLSLVLPQGALYAFPSVVGDAALNFDDHLFALELLETEGVLVVPGRASTSPTATTSASRCCPKRHDLGSVPSASTPARPLRAGRAAQRHGGGVIERRRGAGLATAGDTWCWAIPTASAKGVGPSARWPTKLARAMRARGVEICASALHRAHRLDHRRTVGGASTSEAARKLRPPYGWCRCRSASTTSTAAGRWRSSEPLFSRLLERALALAGGEPGTCWCCRSRLGPHALRARAGPRRARR
jgi:hypothetical protein